MAGVCGGVSLNWDLGDFELGFLGLRVSFWGSWSSVRVVHGWVV